MGDRRGQVENGGWPRAEAEVSDWEAPAVWREVRKRASGLMDGTWRTALPSCAWICVFAVCFFARAQCASFTTPSPIFCTNNALYDPMAAHPKPIPLVAPVHTRPVTHLSFSPLQDDGTYVLISSCKDGNPMLREWTGDWIGTFIGHKGAVWCSKLSPDTSRAASGSADFTA